MGLGFIDTKFKVLDDPELIKKKNAMRLAFREEYLRKVFNPYRHAAGVGGAPFDPNVQRYVAMAATATEYCAPTPKMAFYWVMCLFVPYFGLMALHRIPTSYREAKLRTGQIAYKDRDYKLVF